MSDGEVFADADKSNRYRLLLNTELAFHVRAALLARDQILEAAKWLKSHPRKSVARPASPERQAREFELWLALHAFMNAFGMISKVFFTGDRKASRRVVREPMRQDFRIEADSVFSNRGVRNAFEHFDERIDDWFALPGQVEFQDQIIGRESDLVDVPAGVSRYRSFAFDALVLRAGKYEIKLKPVFEELDWLSSRLNSEHKWENPFAG